MIDAEPAACVLETRTDVFVSTLQRAYTFLRSRRRPDYRGPGARHRDKWDTLAVFLADHQADPYAYAQFVFQKFCFGDIYETVFTSLKVANQFLDELPKIHKNIELSIRLQAQKIKQRLDSGLTIDAVLLNEFNEITPIFSYASALSVGRKDLAENFRERAERQILFEPFLRVLLKDWLPPSMGGTFKM